MSYELSGKIKVIFDTQTFDSGFTKREFVVTTGEDKYPQDIKFSFVKDKCSLLDNWNQGDDVTVHFDIRGNEYKDRYYVDLSAWKMERAKTGGGGGNDRQAGGDDSFGEPPLDIASEGRFSEDPF